MRKLVATTAFAAVLSAMAAGTASAAPTLASLNAKLNCLVRYPSAQFVDYAWYGLLGAPQPSSANAPPTLAGVDPANPATYPPADPPLRNWGPTTGLDLSYGYGMPPDVWLVGVSKSSKCLKKFKVAPNPHPSRSTSFRSLRLSAWR